MYFIATTCTPGYLPDGDSEPPVFDTAREAWAHLAEERTRSEDDDAMASDDDDWDGYSEVVNTLEQYAAGNNLTGALDDDNCGTLSGPTPGYDGDHDLGLCYTVQATEPLDVWLRIPEPTEEDDDPIAEAEANVYRSPDGYDAQWYLTAVGLVKHKTFGTYDDARDWLTSEGFVDYSS